MLILQYVTLSILSLRVKYNITCIYNTINKLSFVGMQLTEKYKENFDVSSKGPSSAVSVTRNYPSGKLFFRQLHELHPYQVYQRKVTKAC